LLIRKKKGNFNGFVTGASTPEIPVRRVVDRIKELTGAEVGQLAWVEEGASFPLPTGLAISGK
jgi:4-hydroxy-3-methylbut-2-enyl diphosphate reductase